MKVTLFEQRLLQSRLDAFAEEAAVGQHDGGAAAGLEQTHDEGQKQICRFLGAVVLGEVTLDAIFLAAAEGRIGEDDVDAVGIAVADVGAGERVVVPDEAGVLNAVQQHVGDAEHVGELLLFDGAQGRLHGLLVF